MADDLEEDDDIPADEGDMEDGEPADEEEGGKRGSKRLLLIIGLVVLLILGLASGAYFSGLLDPVVNMITGEETEQQAPAEGEGDGPAPVGKAVFYDLPEMVVNLNAASREQEFLKIRISLEVASQEDVKKVEQVMPRIVDNFQVYLRELRVQDLQGAAGMYRLREELLRRVNAAVEPAVVKDVLFQEMLVQ